MLLKLNGNSNNFVYFSRKHPYVLPSVPPLTDRSVYDLHGKLPIYVFSISSIVSLFKDKLQYSVPVAFPCFIAYSIIKIYKLNKLILTSSTF